MKYQKEAIKIFDKLFVKVKYWISKQSFVLGWENCYKYLKKQKQLK